MAEPVGDYCKEVVDKYRNEVVESAEGDTVELKVLMRLFDKGFEEGLGISEPTPVTQDMALFSNWKWAEAWAAGKLAAGLVKREQKNKRTVSKSVIQIRRK